MGELEESTEEGAVKVGVSASVTGAVNNVLQKRTAVRKE